MVDISQTGVSAFQGVSRRFICNGVGVSSERFKIPPLGGIETHGTHREGGQVAFHRIGGVRR